MIQKKIINPFEHLKKTELETFHIGLRRLQGVTSSDSVYYANPCFFVSAFRVYNRGKRFIGGCLLFCRTKKGRVWKKDLREWKSKTWTKMPTAAVVLHTTNLLLSSRTFIWTRSERVLS